MPAKNSVKQYLENGFYHIYNRGVEKRRIFLDEQDYAVFLSYLKDYLSFKDREKLLVMATSPDRSYKEKADASQLLSLKNFFGEIELLTYALMPNHFHLLVKQTKEDGIDRFISSLGTRYALFFNKKYKRVGKLYQGVYKAVLVDNDEQLLHLSRYIHLNPVDKLRKREVNSWNKVKTPYSLPEYLGERGTTWIKPEYVLGYFGKTNPQKSYLDFLGGSLGDETFIAKLTIDE
ncbi:MAG: transposase [Patescibacteria group bacterium]